jgi:nickel superoxide dismutase
MRKLTFAVVLAGLTMALAAPVFSHCEIPCGIYDDEMRLDMIAEHITTIEKSMKQIVELSAAGDKNYNQIVRWIDNKEEHAEQLQHIVYQYFMTQRIKPVEKADMEAYAKYQKHLELLHKMLVEAMKSKQTTDTAHTDALRKLLKDFRGSYLGSEG